MSVIPFSFGPSFQEAMLAMMLKDLSFTDKVLKYVPAEHLASDAHRWLYDEIKRKYQAKGTVPSPPELEDRLKKIERAKRRMFKSFAGRIYALTPSDTDFIKDKLTEFAKRANFADLFAYGQTLYNAGKVDDSYAYVMEAIKQVYAVTFRAENAIAIEKFNEHRRRFYEQRLLGGDNIPTGIRPLDTLLRGGLSKCEGELGVILAEPKVGKTVSLIHMGCVPLMMRAGRVAHIVLEGSKETTMFRYQSRLTGIPEDRVKSGELTAEEEERLDEIDKKYMSRLTLIPMTEHWDYTTGDVESALREEDRQGRTPDLCIVDYGDLLKPREKSREERINQRQVYRDLKSLCLMRRMAMWTATQAQRPSDMPDKEAVLRGANVSETFEKVRIADFLASLNQTPREKKMGILRFHADIYRNNACDKTIRLITDFRRMILHSPLLGYIEAFDIPDWMKRRKA